MVEYTTVKIPNKLADAVLAKFREIYPEMSIDSYAAAFGQLGREFLNRKKELIVGGEE